MGLKVGVDPGNYAEAGWGAIFADRTDAALIAAIQPLLDLRREQAGPRCRVYTGGDGFRLGKDTKNSFLARHGAGPGPADPDKVPYYLLIVGSPEQIPYRFQTQLDVQYAVGRLCFETLDEYAAYAQTVVRAERERVQRPRRMAVFGVTNPDDVHTRLTAELLTQPLIDSLMRSYSDVKFENILGVEASKSRLMQLLRADSAPSLLLTVSHGLAFPATDVRHRGQHGALLCADWPGPYHAQPISPAFYFSADDIDQSMRLQGMIALHYSSYSAGRQPIDETTQAPAKQARQLPSATNPPIVARLPQRLLAHPQGGALAVIGLTDQAKSFSMQTTVNKPQTSVFESIVKRVLDGHPIGSAMEFINERYAELSTELSRELEEIEFGKHFDPQHMVELWTANSDVRNFVIVGDPAVRLAASLPRL